MVQSKHQIEAALYAENQDIKAGRLKEESPLDLSENFRQLCEACRRGDLKTCQEKISQGANLNARDRFDYTPLILASLCGHYEVAQLLLESGALCERDTFQGERCLYNALNDRIRNLLLSYDYSKSTNPLQPLAAHITALLSIEHPKTSDITLTTELESLDLHKFILSARSAYFADKLAASPRMKSTTLARQIPAEAYAAALRHLYMSETAVDLGGDDEAARVILEGIDRVSRQLEIPELFEGLVDRGDRRRARQRRMDEISKGQEQLATWFEEKVLQNKMVVDTEKAGSVRWDRENDIFADVLLRADEASEDEQDASNHSEAGASSRNRSEDSQRSDAIPIGPAAAPSRSQSRSRRPRRSVLFPAHRAMLLRSEFFHTMFASSFREAQVSNDYLQVVSVDCSPAVLEVVLQFLYTEKADFDLSIAIDVLFAADLLFIEKLKTRAAMIISSLGSGGGEAAEAVPRDDVVVGRGGTGLEEVVDIYDVVRAGWMTRVHRLEEFGARYIAYRLENYVDEEEFADLVKESAQRVKNRQETDTVELIDDIRYYLSERFRLRFEDAGLDEMMDEDAANAASATPGDDTDRLADSLADTSLTAALDAEPPHGAVYTLDGEIAGDEFAQDAVNYQILLNKIDTLLDTLQLDA